MADALSMADANQRHSDFTLAAQRLPVGDELVARSLLIHTTPAARPTLTMKAYPKVPRTRAPYDVPARLA